MKKIGQVYRENLVDHIKKGINENKNIFFVTYSGLSAPRMNDFRKNLKTVKAGVYVSKNSIARIALKDLNQERIVEKMTGQTAFVWTNADAAEISKVLIKFLEKCENITIQGGLLEGEAIEKWDVKKLADLPSKQVLLAMLFSTIQSPLTRLAGALSAKTRELLSILKQLSETIPMSSKKNIEIGTPTSVEIEKTSEKGGN